MLAYPLSTALFFIVITIHCKHYKILILILFYQRILNFRMVVGILCCCCFLFLLTSNFTTLWSYNLCKEIKPVNPKGNQPWIFTGRTDAEAEAPILWPPDVKNWLIGKDPDAGKDQGQKEKGAAEDEMVGWHHQLNGHEFEQIPGDSGGQRSLACCSSWGHKASDTT